MLGLNQDDMADTFLACLIQRLERSQAQQSAADHGEDPTIAKRMSMLRSRFPGVPAEYIKAIADTFMALMDVIVANNEALETQISRLR